MLIRISILILFTLSACSPHKVKHYQNPDLLIPEAYTASDQQSPWPRFWWTEFKSPMLDSLVSKALKNNLELKQAWERLNQVRAQGIIAGAALYPQVGLQAGASRIRNVDKSEAFTPLNSSAAGGGANSNFTVTQQEYSNRYFLAGSISYEIDLWQRIASGAKAAALRVDAAEAAQRQTQLVLSANVVRAWLNFQERAAQKALLNKQIGLSKTLLELIELRFGLGQGSALDVFQQQDQLLSTQSELPLVTVGQSTAQNSISILLAEAPQLFQLESPSVFLPQLPDFPELGSPETLLRTRPDLIVAWANLQAQDYELARALAERLPQLSVSLNTELSTGAWSSLFEREFGSLVGNLVAPLIDGGRRRAEVRRQRAILNERLHAFGQAYLEALKEIEDAIAFEKAQKDFLVLLDKRRKILQLSFDQARNRYMNGLDTYLSVLVSLQSLQRIERQLISENKVLLLNRVQLYLALGGLGKDQEEAV